MARSENRTTPKVFHGVLYGNDSFSVGSDSWQQWLAGGQTFYFESNLGTFTARSEARGGVRYWYAYRREHGKLRKRYLGKSADLTLDRMNEIAQRLGMNEQHA